MRIRDNDALVVGRHGCRCKGRAGRHGDNAHGDHSFLDHVCVSSSQARLLIALNWGFAPPLRMAALREAHAILVYIGDA